MTYCQCVWGHVGDVALHKLCTLLYYLVRLQSALVGSVFSSVSSLLEEWATTATCHRLAQGWVNACNTRVERLLRLLRNGSNCPKIHTIVRSVMIFGHAWTVISWRLKELVGHAIPGILHAVTRLQFAVTDTTLVVLVAPQQRPIIHVDRISVTYSIWI